MRKLTALLLCLCLLISYMTWAQQKGKTSKYRSELPRYNHKKEREGVKFNIIPGPSYDPATKFGLFLIPMLNYYPSKGDTLSPVSTSSLFGMYTTNNSWIIGGRNALFLAEDKWRLIIGGGYGSLNKDLTLQNIDPDTKLPVLEEPVTTVDAKQIFYGVNLQVQRKIWSNLYMGLGYAFRNTYFEGRNGEADTLITLNGLARSDGNHALRLLVDWDSRDNVQFPYKGYLFSYQAAQFFNSGGDEQNNAYFSNIIKLTGFWSLSSNHRHILAGKAFGRFLTGDPNKANYAYYGRINGDTQRGYQSGKRYDKHAVNMEFEYRWITPWINNRIGFTGILGSGRVFGDINSFKNAEWLPMGGVGVRYSILPYERINMRFDATFSKDGFVWYFAVRESF